MQDSVARSLKPMRPALLPRSSLAALALALSLAGCGVSPEAELPRAERTYSFDWPKEGIRATFEYRTLVLFQRKPVCTGNVSIQNYGSRNYAMVYFRVSVFSPLKELIATDRFLLVGSLNAGGRAEIPSDPFKTLEPVVITKSFSECPKNMDAATVQLEVS